MSDNTTNEITTSNQWMFSTRCLTKDGKRDFVFVKEKHISVDKNNNITNVENKHSIINEPKRKLWVTKKQFRTHKDKKESEDITKCDEYVVKDSEMVPELKKIFNIPFDRFMKFKQICNSPYIYGADVSMEALVRIKYFYAAKHRILQFNTGGLDIEASVLGCNRINVITVVLDKDIYTGVLRDFMDNNVDEYGRHFTPTKKEQEEFNRQVCAPYIDKHNFKLHFEIFDDEISMIEWIFSKIHLHRVDFLSIWNIGYDFPVIIDRIEKNNRDVVDLLHDSTIDPKYKYFWYQADNRKTQHNTDKWPWVHWVSYTQPIDSMLNYARVRKQQTKESKYTLDFISKKVLGKGKLEFDDNADHYTMQTKYFKKYIAYNIIDSVILQLMNYTTKDHAALVELTGMSPLRDFSKQTVMLKDQLYDYYLRRKRVLGTVPATTEEPHSKYLEKLGGTVLQPYRIKHSGLNALREYPDIETMAFVLGFDEDFSSVYPFSKISHNVSKDTKLSSFLNIDGVRDVGMIEKLCGGICTPIENAVPISNKFFRLPDYIEMEDLITKHLKLKHEVSYF